MAKLLLIILFSLCTQICLSQSQQTLNGVWGINFGTSADSVKMIVKKKNGKSPYKTSDGGNILHYEDCDFGGRKASIIKLLFWDDQFYSAIIYFFPDKDPQILFLYNSIKDDVKDKWWPPQVEAEAYKSPFKKGDGYEVTAIKGGYSTIGAIWYFPELSKSNEQGGILLQVDENMWVELQYMDNHIYKKANSKLKEKKESDF